MQPGQQLELFAPPKGGGVPQDHWSAAAARNKSARPGAQLELPIPGDVLATRSTTAPVEKTPEQKLRAGVHPIDSHHGGTYPMFMTGPEIQHQFQALDGDRYDEPNYEDSMHPEGVTIRGTRSAAYEGPRAVNKSVYDTNGDKRLGVTRRPFKTGEQIPSLRAPLSKLPETDENLYRRKYDEADHDEDAWHEDYDMPMPGRGLVEKIGEHGYDWNHPVHLADGTANGDRDYSGGRGTFGKYQVLGGHHRIAVMNEDHPRQFMPVQWHTDFHDASASHNYY